MGEIKHKVRLSGLKKTVEVEALFDSGSTYGHIDKKLADEIGFVVLPQKFNVKFGDSTEKMMEATAGLIEIKGCVHPVMLGVQPHATPQLSIGWTLMQAIGIKLDPKQERIILDECKMPRA